MTVNQVCRLCLSDKELLWIFDEKCNSSVNKLKDVVMTTTGIEILEKDVVSQKICSNCCDLTQKMFQFRERAAKTDKFLKDQCRELLNNNKVALKIPNTSVSIKKSEKKKDTSNSIKERNKMSIKSIPKTNSSKEHKRASEVIPANKPENSKMFKRKIDPSIQKIFCVYENIKLPSESLNMDINPSVCMEIDSVETYFRLHNLDMKKHVQMVLRSNRTAKKIGKSHSIEGSKRNNQDITSIKEDKNKGNKKVSPISGERVKEQTKYPRNKNATISKVNQSSILIEKEELTINNNCKNKKGKAQSKRSLEFKNERKSLKIKRQKLSLNEESEKSPTLMQTLQLKQSLDVPRCNICNYPAKNSIELKKHHHQHFQCTYCKAIFKTIKYKEEHDRKCLVKHALTSQPYVSLEKISIPNEDNKPRKKDEIIKLSDDENDISTHHKSPAKSLVQSTLKSFLSVKAHTQTSTSNQVQPQLSTTISQRLQASKSDLRQNEVFIPLDQLESFKLEQALLQASISVQVQPKQSTSAPAPTPALKSVLPSTSVEVLTHSKQVTSSSEALSTSILARDQMQTETDSVPLSSGIVRPSIQIFDNARLNTIDTSGQDIGVLKDLLKTNLPEKRFTNVNEAQTSFPSNYSLNVDNKNEIAVFKNLLPQLSLYNIPINVKKGNFKASYVKNKQPESRQNMHHWYNVEAFNLRSENGYFSTPNFKNRVRQGTSIFAPRSLNPTTRNNVSDNNLIQAETSNILTELSNTQAKVGNKQGNHFSEQAQIINVPRNTGVHDNIGQGNINLHKSQLHNLSPKVRFKIKEPRNRSVTSSRNNPSTNVQQPRNSTHIRQKYWNNIQPIPTTDNRNGSMIFSEASNNLNQNMQQVFSNISKSSNTGYVVPPNHQMQSSSSHNSTSTSNRIGFNNIPSSSNTYFDRPHESVFSYSNSATSNPILSQKPVLLNNTLANNLMLNSFINTNPPINPSVQSLAPNLTPSTSKTNNRLLTNADTTFTDTVVSNGNVIADKNVLNSNVVQPLIRVRNLCELK